METLKCCYENEVVVITPKPDYIIQCKSTGAYHDIVYLPDESTISDYVGVDKQSLHVELKKFIETFENANDEQDVLIIEQATSLAAMKLTI